MNGAVARTCAIQAQQVTLEGELVVPEGAAGIVLFAHGSGSSRHSPRNNAVARAPWVTDARERRVALPRLDA
jgi:hypothetical protein